MQHWFDYVKVSYDLVIETESRLGLVLEHEVEAYVVHLFAKNINRVDIGHGAVALKVLEHMHNPELLARAADECLLIHSYPLRRNRWPTDTYYIDMGTVAYALAGNTLMESNFVPASKVLGAVFKQN